MRFSLKRKVQFVPFRNQNYQSIHDECLKTQKLFIDTTFPLEKTQLINDETRKNLIWRRPHDLSDNPKFFIRTPNRRDPGQGDLSDCWFVVAIANITSHRKIFERIVPIEQTFDKENGYAGIFHFHFWQYGRWYDVVIDDYLPFNKKTRQPWCSWNRQEPEEFWVSLIEKAYAKLNGGYRNLIGGAPIEAFTDLTAGVEQRFKLNDSIEDHDQFFRFLVESLKYSCLMACSINPKPDGSDLEQIKDNGLVVGHSYSVTAARYLKIDELFIRMIRLRNPWANEIEWQGSWNDQDPQWQKIHVDERRRMSWEDAEDGEFWMSFDDFFREFDILEICHLSPDTFEDELDLKKSFPDTPNKTWSCFSFEDEWNPYTSSGGRCVTSCDHGCRFWINPQYIVDSRISNSKELSAIVISLMQKYNRLKPIDNPIDRYDYIQARLYRLKNQDGVVPTTPVSYRLKTLNYDSDDLEYIGYTGSYINRREVTFYVRVPRGKYLIIPSLYEPNRSGKYLLRIFLEMSDSLSTINVSETEKTQTKLSVATPVRAGRPVKPVESRETCCPCFVKLIKSNERTSKIQIFHLNQSLFKIKRKEHHDVIETLAKMKTDVKRYKAVQILTEQIFRVLNESQTVLTGVGFVPSVSSFPTDETTREQLSLLLENVLFLGDLALFFPDIFHRFYDQDQQRRSLTSWSYSFAVETEFYDEKSLEIVSLMAQELNLIEKSKTFHNPYVYRENNKINRDEKIGDDKKESNPKKKESKPKKKRGPGLSAGRIEL